MDKAIVLKRAIALALLVIIVVAFIIVPNSPLAREDGDGSMTVYSTSDDEKVSFDDCTRFRQMLEDQGHADYDMYTIIGSPTILRDIEEPERSLYIVLGVERDYKPADVQMLKNFYERGGSLIVADDFGFGNTLAEEFDVHFYNKRMYDERFYHNISFVMTNATLDLEEYSLVMDTPTGLMVHAYDRNVSVVASGSRNSYVDINGNGHIDTYDIQGPIPVIAVYRTGRSAGTIVFVSDPGLFSDDKVALSGYDNTTFDNERFLRHLVVDNLLPNGGNVIFDEGRHEPIRHMAPVQGALESVTILTSSPREMTLLMTGMVIIMLMAASKARDKEDWVHRHDVGRITMTPNLPASRRELRDRLRASVLRKLGLSKGLTREELRSLTGTQLASMIKDHDLNELVLNEERDLSNEELRLLTDKVRGWKAT